MAASACIIGCASIRRIVRLQPVLLFVAIALPLASLGGFMVSGVPSRC
jgi:hypothetical protein